MSFPSDDPLRKFSSSASSSPTLIAAARRNNVKLPPSSPVASQLTSSSSFSPLPTTNTNKYVLRISFPADGRVSSVAELSFAPDKLVSDVIKSAYQLQIHKKFFFDTTDAPSNYALYLPERADLPLSEDSKLSSLPISIAQDLVFKPRPRILTVVCTKTFLVDYTIPTETLHLQIEQHFGLKSNSSPTSATSKPTTSLLTEPGRSGLTRSGHDNSILGAERPKRIEGNKSLSDQQVGPDSILRIEEDQALPIVLKTQAQTASSLGKFALSLSAIARPTDSAFGTSSSFPPPSSSSSASSSSSISPSSSASSAVASDFVSSSPTCSMSSSGPISHSPLLTPPQPAPSPSPRSPRRATIGYGTSPLAHLNLPTAPSNTEHTSLSAGDVEIRRAPVEKKCKAQLELERRVAGTGFAGEDGRKGRRRSAHAAVSSAITREVISIPSCPPTPPATRTPPHIGAVSAGHSSSAPSSAPLPRAVVTFDDFKKGGGGSGGAGSGKKDREKEKKMEEEAPPKFSFNKPFDAPFIDDKDQGMKKWKVKLQGLKQKDEERVFGQNLDRVLEREAIERALPASSLPQWISTNNSIPSIVQITVDWIRQHALRKPGVFRLSGSNDKIAQYKQLANKGMYLDFTNQDPNTVTGLLKLYLRELPDPLLTFNLYPRFLASDKLTDEKQKRSYYSTLISSLPKANRATLSILLELMTDIARYQSENQMGVNNLAIVLGPCIMLPPADDLNQSARMLAEAGQTIRITEWLIKEYPACMTLGNDVLRTYRVETSYSATSSSELNLSSGDIIHVYKKSPAGLWYAELQATGAVGIVVPPAVKCTKLLAGFTGNTTNIPTVKDKR